MNIKKTTRGFSYLEFKDDNHVDCNIQVSSAYDEDALIWFGAKNIGLKHFKPGEGWKDVELVETEREYYIANNRMHLSQTKVKELLPILQHFAETGELRILGQENEDKIEE